MKRLIGCAAVGVCLITIGCSKKNGTAQSTVKPPVAVEVATVASAERMDGIEVTGSLEPKFSVDVKTQIPGLITQVYVTEWVRVRKGQPLARIDVAETEAQVKRAEAGIESARANLAQAMVSVQRGERELARMLKLKEAGLATQQAVDDARSEADAARARADASRAQSAVAAEEARQARARLGKGLVVSPIDGVVALRAVNVGDLASDAAVGKPVFRIVDNRLLNLTVTVASADAARIKVGQRVEFTVDSLPERSFSGRVMFINPELNPSDRSLKVIAEVQNVPELLKGGMFVKGRIETGARSNVIQIPRSAISRYEPTLKKGVVYLVENGTAREQSVATGSAAGDQIEVVSGLSKGQQYVVRGGFNLKNGELVSAVAVIGGGK